MNAKTNIIERPLSTLDPKYVYQKEKIYAWRSKNKEKVREYNRLYAEKRRQDPLLYEEIKTRTELRAYLTKKWLNSFKTIARLGLNREQLAAREGMTETEFVEMLRTHEIDHIVSASWFRKAGNEYLSPFMYRHYNLQFVPRGTNRQKFSYVDESDPRIKIIICRMKLDVEISKNSLDPVVLKKIQSLNAEIQTLIQDVKRLESTQRKKRDKNALNAA